MSFFILGTAFAQQKNTVIEDDYETLKGKIRLYFNASTDRALMYAEQMAKSSNYEHLAFANGAMSCLLESKGETEKSNEKYNKALAYLDKMPESKVKKSVMSSVYNYKGLTEWYRGNHSAALEKFQEGIKLSSEIGDIKQIIKFKSNIALINKSIGNLQLSIKISKEIIDFLDKNEALYTKNDLLNVQSGVYLSLGGAYENYFVENKNVKTLDSAAYFYKKTILYSKLFPDNLTIAKLSLGNILNWKGGYKNAEKTYYEVIALVKQTGSSDLSDFIIAYYNLGDIYLTTKKYNKALVFFRKSDSVSLLTNNEPYTYLKSNCYQARIYNMLRMPELAHKHSRIYLDRLDEFESKLREERLNVNYKQGEENLTAEMLSIEKKYKQDLFLTRGLNFFYILLFLALLFLLIKSISSKNKVQKEMIILTENSKAKIVSNARPIAVKPKSF
ncbi:tetratricopeptide repeat protein [Flavobacterium frigidimaris]|uniref:tetratricopeptide repeat protein n=1 Tax=Flavobacterium frigidimaris TaxID=262320 RepID=UPI001A95779F|nr:tetratricopeptide repeat protein [Flavobacterium frigidimaris]